MINSEKIFIEKVTESDFSTKIDEESKFISEKNLFNYR